MMEPQNEMEECANCLFWCPSDSGSPRGECRRFAPRGSTIDDARPIGARAVWPRTLADEWCGDFKGQGA